MTKLKEISLGAIFQNSAERRTDRPCVAYNKDGNYVNISWIEMNEKIRDLAAFFMSEGIKKGDKIGLFSPNRYEWWVADQAILSIGAIDVPIYATNSSDEAYFNLNDSDSKMCVVGTEEQMDKIIKVKKKLPKMTKIIIFDNPEKKKKDVVTFENACEKGKSYKNRSAFDKRLAAVGKDDIATIMYTSGTTGNPKGVMLTHGNFLSQVEDISIDASKYVNENDTFLSFLPLSHVFERSCGYYLATKLGSTVAFAQSINTLMENFQQVRPTIIISVPRIYEKVHAGILAKVADSPGIKKAIFSWAMGVAKKNLPFTCTNESRPSFLDKKFNIADKLVFSGLKETLGMDKLKFAVSGGGPLSVSDAEFFIGMGMRICEGFGLTETSPVTNWNRPERLKPGTVGRPLKRTTVKISDDGELLIKGPGVMKGYYKNPKATKETFTKDGFFKSGDLAVIDEDGFLAITGRIKDIIVTAGGKNISPQNIEGSIKASKYIEQIAIIGDRRKYLSALIIPAFDEISKWAKRTGIDFVSIEDLYANEKVVALIQSEIEKYTKQFARVEQIRKFRILDAEWTQESGELTPTQKVKRKVVSEKYSSEIDEMYPN